MAETLVCAFGTCIEDKIEAKIESYAVAAKRAATAAICWKIHDNVKAIAPERTSRSNR